MNEDSVIPTMSLIEGVGDEVMNFLLLVSILVISWIAWCSTSISDQPPIRTVLILQQRNNTRNRIADFRSNQTTNRINDNSELNSEEASALDTRDINEIASSCPDTSTFAGNGESTDSTTSQEVPATSRTDQVDSTMRTSPDSTRPEMVVSTEEQLIQVMDSPNSDSQVNLLNVDMEQPNSRADNLSSQPNASMEQVDQSENERQTQEDNISIKLKFINDEQKLVSASLKERLGDFKRRHFQLELESQKRVRLVFKGHILQPDTLTLERCGLYNNCVVHCLVHQPRNNISNASHSSTENTSPLYFNAQNVPTGTGLNAVQQDWDLSKVFLGVLILILGLAWYTRYYYAQHYNVTSTVVLYSLTTIFIISVVSQFYSDEEGLRNIE